IVTQQKLSARSDVQGDMEMLPPVSSSGVGSPTSGSTAVYITPAVPEYADNRAQYWRMKRSRSHKFLQALGSRVAANFARIDMRSHLEKSYQSLKAMQLGQFGRETAKIARSIRTAAVPALTTISNVAGPRFRASTTRFATSAYASARHLQGWATKTLPEEMYGKTFVGGVTAATILYFIARTMDPAQSWQHPGLFVLAFAGLLLCALSLALGAAILLRSKQRLRKDSSELVTSAVRWLQAPMGPAQFRDLSPAGGKVHSQRRAS
ncbi:MAG: hypothetical protein ABLQ96_13035, partial [Candidatus Acidiferrum sp.]